MPLYALPGKRPRRHPTAWVAPGATVIGAGALVTEGRSFPPGSLIVGSPARAVRALDAAAIATLRLSAVHYAERAARYAAELVRVE